jgi:hypothetical protein
MLAPYFAFIIWMIFHVGFLVFGLEQQNYAMMMIMYGIRGLAYPITPDNHEAIATTKP